MSIFGAMALATAVVIPANAAGSTRPAHVAGSNPKVTNCTWAALSAALASGGTIDIDCTGSIGVPTPIVVGSGQRLTVVAPGQPVTLYSQENPSDKSRIFDVQANASLALNNLFIISSRLAGTDGKVGADGQDGVGAQAYGG